MCLEFCIAGNNLIWILNRTVSKILLNLPWTGVSLNPECNDYSTLINIYDYSFSVDLIVRQKELN